MVPKGTLEPFPVEFSDKEQDGEHTTEPVVRDKGPYIQLALCSSTLQSARPSSAASFGDGGHPATSEDDDNLGYFDDDDYKPARSASAALTSKDPLHTRSRAAASSGNGANADETNAAEADAAEAEAEESAVDIDTMRKIRECTSSCAIDSF
jgi:hypothetical protein